MIALARPLRAASHSENQRQLVRAVLPSADAGVRLGRARRGRAPSPAGPGWQSDCLPRIHRPHYDGAVVRRARGRRARRVLDRRWRRLALRRRWSAARLVLIAAATVGPMRGAVATWTRHGSSGREQGFAVRHRLACLGLGGELRLSCTALVGTSNRVRRGTATCEDEGLVWGATALAALFLVTLPFVVMKMSLAVQFQISRVFWLVDFIALVYVTAAVIERPLAGSRRRTRRPGCRCGPSSSPCCCSRFPRAAAPTSCSSSALSVRYSS